MKLFVYFDESKQKNLGFFEKVNFLFNIVIFDDNKKYNSALTLMHSDKNVDNIDKIKGVVNDVPTNGEVFSHFPEDGTTHHKNDIIKDGTEYDKQPIVM